MSRALDRLLEAHDPLSDPDTDFRRAQFDHGLAWVWAEEGCGGLGVERRLQDLVRERLSAAGYSAPERNFVGLYQAATAVREYGTSDQQRRWLRPAFTCEEEWCQLFSEPGAGSDLAGLATYAFRDGDEWVVSGQKLWTSGAKSSRWAILLARTDKDVPKHRGLTFFVCDMRSPGLDVRSLRQADGGSHFNEVFLHDVRVPDDCRIGEIGQGWAVSLAGLGSEREGVGRTTHPNLGIEGGPETLIALWRERGAESAAHAAVLKDRVVASWIAHRVMDWSNVRIGSGHDGGSSASLLKLMRSRTAQDANNLCMDLLGPEATVGADYAWESTGGRRNLQMQFIRSRANSIEGGTSEIMRNIIGERLLGLPGDVRVDKDVAWRAVPRG